MRIPVPTPELMGRLRHEHGAKDVVRRIYQLHISLWKLVMEDLVRLEDDADVMMEEWRPVLGALDDVSAAIHRLADSSVLNSGAIDHAMTRLVFKGTRPNFHIRAKKRSKRR